jgi:hypothetical protein
LSKILAMNASLLKLLAKLLTNQPDASSSTNKTPSRCKRIHSLAKDHTQQPLGLGLEGAIQDAG